MTREEARVSEMACVTVLRPELIVVWEKWLSRFVDLEQGVKASLHGSVTTSESCVSLYQPSLKRGHVFASSEKWKTVLEFCDLIS